MNIDALHSSFVSTAPLAAKLGRARAKKFRSTTATDRSLENFSKQWPRGTRQEEQGLDTFIAAQKKKLLELREAVHSMANGVKSSLRSCDETSKASAFGVHKADAASEANDRDFALSLLSQEQDALFEIEQALERITSGAYGLCAICGQAIPRARLEAIPFARLTVECQSRIEKGRKTHRVRQSAIPVVG